MLLQKMTPSQFSEWAQIWGFTPLHLMVLSHGESELHATSQKYIRQKHCSPTGLTLGRILVYS
jgi:hypothetical protein